MNDMAVGRSVSEVLRLVHAFQLTDQCGEVGEILARILGYKINHQGITPLPNKVQSILDFPRPTTQKQLLQFLGMLNFYRKTLPNIKIQDKNRKVFESVEVPKRSKLLLTSSK